jgi:spermidine synthase
MSQAGPAVEPLRMCRWAVTLMLASGFAGLGYQVVWTQQSAVWLGHETAAVLAIVAAFFAGLGIGAWTLGGRIDRSRRPAAWYAACELIIATWSAALIWLMAPVSRALLEWSGPQPHELRQWSLAFGGTFLLLLPATAAMGATLPAMERLVAGARAHRLPVALLYSANTFGAVLGVLAAAFLLVPRLGLSATALVCVALNLLCAIAAWRLRATSEPPPAEATPSPATGLVTLAVTGLLGIGYEVLVVRALSQVAENTVFTFALLLAVYLVGTALGAAAYARWPRADSPRTRDRLLRLQSLACLLGALALLAAQPFKTAVLEWSGPGVAGALLAEALLACLVFLLPTMVMGALFSHLVAGARQRGVSLGAALGVNTLAASLAPALFGVWLLPMLGTTLALCVVAAGYLLIVPAWRNAPQLIIAAGAVAFAWWRPPLAAVDLPEGGRLLSHVEGVAATVSVVADASGVATLHINNRQQEGSSATAYSDGRQALLPLLLHSGARSALFLGLGTGATARTAARDPALRVDAVELLPEVIAASTWFAAGQQSPDSPRLDIRAADARRYVRVAPVHYDVIVSDNFHPARSGSAGLYTREHFAAVRERLAAGGLFCQWLPLHQLDLATTRSIVRTYLAVFPKTFAVLATNSLETPVLGLVTRHDGELLDLARLQAALTHPRMRQAGDFELQSELAVLGNFVAGPESLARFSSGAPLNTDDHAVVAWMAPAITYDPVSSPRERLLELLATLQVNPAELAVDSASAWNRRLGAYWDARNRYLAAGAAVQPSGDVRVMLSQVRSPLLAVLETSPEFRPAYLPLVHMARALAEVDVHEARALLRRLVKLCPGWPEAGETLRELG